MGHENFKVSQATALSVGFVWDFYTCGKKFSREETLGEWKRTKQRKRVFKKKPPFRAGEPYGRRGDRLYGCCGEREGGEKIGDRREKGRHRPRGYKMRKRMKKKPNLFYRKESITQMGLGLVRGKASCSNTTQDSGWPKAVQKLGSSSRAGSFQHRLENLLNERVYFASFEKSDHCKISGEGEDFEYN